MKHSEQVAQLVVEAVMPGAKMGFVADQSTSVCDFDLVLPTGAVVALEVTSATEPLELGTTAAITSPKHGGHTIKAVLCKRPWRIRPRADANIKKLRANADAALADVEAAGFEHFGPGATPNHPAIRRAANELRIFFGDIIANGQPGVIAMAPPMGGGAIGATLVHDAVLAEGWKSDNIAKLQSSKLAEKHLAVYVDPANHRVWVPLIDLPPPPNTVDLPPCVTFAWVFSEARAAGHYVVWRAAANGQWNHCEIGPLPSPQSHTAG